MTIDPGGKKNLSLQNQPTLITQALQSRCTSSFPYGSVQIRTQIIPKSEWRTIKFRVYHDLSGSLPNVEYFQVPLFSIGENLA